MNNLNLLLNIILFGYLAVASYTDITTRKISLRLSVITALCCTALQFFLKNCQIIDLLIWILCGSIVGLVLLLLGVLTRESIGYGDGISVLVIGIALGLKGSFLICSLAFLLSAVTALFLIIRKASRKATLPFLPFLCAGYVIHIIFL